MRFAPSDEQKDVRQGACNKEDSHSVEELYDPYRRGDSNDGVKERKAREPGEG
jgi:hypothetical protein